VSPLNSRAALLELIEGAREQLLIYDSRLSDNQMQRVLERQAMKGVEVRVIGKVEKDLREVSVRKYGADRLHVRAIVRDGERVFIGSQSLRRAELERRREIGIIFDDARVASQIATIFDEDWVLSSGSKEKGARRASA
jgi:cardiolipin synthase